MKNAKIWALGLFVSILFVNGAEAKPSQTAFGNVQVTKLIVMPNASGHTDWVNAINGAKKSLHLEMYHITDSAIVTALSTLAKNKNVDLKVIVDGGSLTGGYETVFQQLTSAGVQIRGSSTAFTLTHSKAMTVDDTTAFITAINMTNTYANTRDFGVITPDANIISEFESVFQADWANAASKAGTTPAVTDPDLAWAPTTANNQLLALINSATTTLDMESETFSDPAVIAALNAAAARKVAVRLILPQCVLGNGTYNYPGIAQLKGVSVNVEVDGDSVAQPYLHSKMMLVDNKTIYIGSINMSASSIQNDREVGIIFTDSATSSTLASEFQTDWNRSQAAPSTAPSCPASTPEVLRDMGF